MKIDPGTIRAKRCANVLYTFPCLIVTLIVIVEFI